MLFIHVKSHIKIEVALRLTKDLHCPCVVINTGIKITFKFEH